MSGPKRMNRYRWVTHDDGSATITEVYRVGTSWEHTDKKYPTLDAMLFNLPGDVATYSNLSKYIPNCTPG